MGEGLGPWELGDFTAAKPKCIHSQTPINWGPRLWSRVGQGLAQTLFHLATFTKV